MHCTLSSLLLLFYVAEAEVRHERMLKEKNAIIQHKEEEISELKSKMDDMAEEFGEMLRVRCILHNIIVPYSIRTLRLFLACSNVGNFGEDARAH